MTMKNIALKVAAVGLLGLASLAPSTAFAGKGGSAAAIQAAVASRSTDAIIAEIERAESLICEECIQTITGLTEDSRFAVREVAAWWFARRPALKEMLATQFLADLPTGTTIQVRNAADFLGRTRTFTALPQLGAGGGHGRERAGTGGGRDGWDARAGGVRGARGVGGGRSRSGGAAQRRMGARP